MVGAEVTELIQGFVVAMNLETTEEELMHTIFRIHYFGNDEGSRAGCLRPGAQHVTPPSSGGCHRAARSAARVLNSASVSNSGKAGTSRPSFQTRARAPSSGRDRIHPTPTAGQQSVKDNDNLTIERPTFVTHLECAMAGDHYPADQIHNLSKAGKRCWCATISPA